jgi:hypothetical protein
MVVAEIACCWLISVILTARSKQPAIPEAVFAFTATYPHQRLPSLLCS